jgi:hypothetical protein
VLYPNAIRVTASAETAQPIHLPFGPTENQELTFATAAATVEKNFLIIISLSSPIL